MSKRKINAISELTLQDLPLLEHMEKIGQQLAEKQNLEGANWKFGYHSVPSLPPLHLHVISDDFDSSCLRTKKHWNSFTTDFFRDSKDVIDQLQKGGKVEVDKNFCEALLQQRPKCFICHQEFPTMPKLLSHYGVCRKKQLRTHRE